MFVTGGLLLGLLAVGTPVSAAPFQWQIYWRNLTDTADQLVAPPKSATSTIALLGARSHEPQGQPSWYYPDTTQFGINFGGPDPLDSNGKTLSIQAVDWSIVTGLSELLNEKANQTDVTALQNQVNAIPQSVARSIASSSVRTITTGTGATGFQVSTSSPADGRYSVTIVSTASIAGSSQGTVVLEIAPVNSATTTAWSEVGRCTNGQALSLAITLQSVQTTACQLSAFIPAGWYAKLRSISTAGTPTFTVNSQQEVLH